MLESLQLFARFENCRSDRCAALIALIGRSVWGQRTQGNPQGNPAARAHRTSWVRAVHHGTVTDDKRQLCGKLHVTLSRVPQLFKGQENVNPIFVGLAWPIQPSLKLPDKVKQSFEPLSHLQSEIYNR